MRKYNIVFDGRMDYEFGEDNAVTSREIAAQNGMYLKLNNINKRKLTLKKSQ